MEELEPKSMLGQPPLIWDRAEGVHVYDPYGNKWLDWSSGVLVANVGHAPAEIRAAAAASIEKGQMFSYCFPAENRIRLARRIVEISPDGLDKVFFLTTGSETTECAIKLSRAHGQAVGGANKLTIVSFGLGFHGRTMGAQQAGGSASAKTWIGNLDPGFVQVPFPDGYFCEDVSFDLFERSLAAQGIDPDSVAGVMMETYQGGVVALAPNAYVRALRDWCDKHRIILIFDEVQAGFGRTGKLFAFEHYGVVPDLVCLGKAISGGLPLAAVLGRRGLLDQFGPGSMTSTWGGHSTSCAAALANLDLLIDGKLAERAGEMGAHLRDGLRKIMEESPRSFGALLGTGMVYGLHVVDPASGKPDSGRAFEIVRQCFHAGLLMFAPVGPNGATVKIAPPLIIERPAIEEGLQVLREVVRDLA
jgi:4-aminobutyrate aminotransferase-like enzyme